MQIKLQKYLFMGLELDQNRFFALAQEFGIIQFTDQKKFFLNLPPALQNLKLAQSILRRLKMEHPSHVCNYRSGFDLLPEDAANETLALYQRMLELQHEKKLQLQELDRIKPLGDFDLSDINYIESHSPYKVNFFTAPEKYLNEIQKKYPHLILLNRTNQTLYFVSITDQLDLKINLTPFNVATTPHLLKETIHQITLQIESMTHQLLDHSCHLDQIDSEWYKVLNTNLKSFCTNKAQIVEDCKIFAVEGWVPVNTLEKLKKLTTELSIEALPIAANPDEIVPTHLVNQGISKIGEDLVEIYDTPSAQDKDPSLWILLSFATFFSMIISDAGYGLVYLLIALYFQFSKKPQKLKKINLRIINLVTILAFATCLWGINTGSFFGFALFPDSFVSKFSLINWMTEVKAQYHFTAKDLFYKELSQKYNLFHITDFSQWFKVLIEGAMPIKEKMTNSLLMEFSLIIGIVHIIISFARSLPSNKSALGWIGLLIGGYLFLPQYLNAIPWVQTLLHLSTENTIAAGKNILIISGLYLSILSFFKGILGPVNDLMTGVQIFSDVMSYLRLYALGLSGAMMAQTFNHLAQTAPLVVAPIIFLLGHALNLSLSIMSGVLHGLRLNFLEWYHYSFEGGGKRFTPLQFFTRRD